MSCTVMAGGRGATSRGGVQLLLLGLRSLSRGEERPWRALQGSVQICTPTSQG